MHSLEELHTTWAAVQAGDKKLLNTVIKNECRNGQLAGMVLGEPTPSAYVAYKLMKLLIQHDSEEASQCFERVVVALCGGRKSYFGWRLCLVALASSRANSVKDRVHAAPEVFPLKVVAACSGGLTLQLLISVTTQSLEDPDSLDMIAAIISKEVSPDEVEDVLAKLLTILQDARVMSKPLLRGGWIHTLLHHSALSARFGASKTNHVRQVLRKFLNLLDRSTAAEQSLEVIEMINCQDETLFAALNSLLELGVRCDIQGGPLHYASIFSALLTLYDYDYDVFVDLLLSSDASVLCLEYLLNLSKVASADTDNFLAAGSFRIPRLVEFLSSLERMITSRNFPFDASPLGRAIHKLSERLTARISYECQ